MIDRRAFVRRSAALAAAPLALAGCEAGPSRQPDPDAAPANDRWFDISLAQWSLHRCLRGEQRPAIDNLQFAATARGLGFDAVEYVNQFFADRATDAGYLAEMRLRAAGSGVANLLIMVDGEGALGAPDAATRARAVEAHVKWLDAAAALDCHSIRVNAESSGTWSEQRDRAADGLRALCERAEPYGLNVLVENHGGLSSNGQWLAAVMERVDHDLVGTLPDFGNFDLGGGRLYDRYDGVAELMPYAKAVSAKSHDFDANGDEVHTDYRRMLGIVLAAGYRGHVGVEYEGRGDEHDGIRRTRALLERVRTELAG